MQKKDPIYQESVETTTLRDYIYKNDIKHIYICKIDTEGLDEQVIKGLYEYLENRAINYFIFEYDTKSSYEKIKKFYQSMDIQFTTWREMKIL